MNEDEKVRAAVALALRRCFERAARSLEEQASELLQKAAQLRQVAP